MGFGRALAEDARSGGSELTEDLRRGAKEYADELEKQLARAIVTVDPPDAAISVDGRPLEPLSVAGTRPVLAAGTRPDGPGEPAPAATFELVLDPGRHSFLARSGTSSRSIEEHAAAGAPLRVTVSVRPVAPRAAAAPPRSAAAPSPERRPVTAMATQKTGAIVLGSLGLASLAAGTVLGVVAASRWDDALDACPARTACPDDRGRELSEEAGRYGNLATVAWVTAGVAAAGSIVLWLTAPSSERRSSSSATSASHRPTAPTRGHAAPARPFVRPYVAW